MSLAYKSFISRATQWEDEPHFLLQCSIPNQLYLLYSKVRLQGLRKWKNGKKEWKKMKNWLENWKQKESNRSFTFGRISLYLLHKSILRFLFKIPYAEDGLLNQHRGLLHPYGLWGPDNSLHGGIY